MRTTTYEIHCTVLNIVSVDAKEKHLVATRHELKK
jgi:hypothetical protein